MSASSINYRATANIRPSRFLMEDPATPYGCKEATGSSFPVIGISQMGTRGAPGTPFDTGFAAASGDQIEVFSDESHDEPLLVLGAAVTGGQYLKPDSNGFGIPTVNSSGGLQYYGAQARDSGASGDLIRVSIRIGSLYS